MTDFVRPQHLDWLHRDEDELLAALHKTMLEKVVPALRETINAAAADVAGQFENTIWARDFSAEILIRLVAEYVTLSDTAELELIRPHQLSDDYAREFFAFLVGYEAQS